MQFYLPVGDAALPFYGSSGVDIFCHFTILRPTMGASLYHFIPNTGFSVLPFLPFYGLAALTFLPFYGPSGVNIFPFCHIIPHAGFCHFAIFTIAALYPAYRFPFFRFTAQPALTCVPLLPLRPLLDLPFYRPFTIYHHTGRKGLPFLGPIGVNIFAIIILFAYWVYRFADRSPF